MRKFELGGVIPAMVTPATKDAESVDAGAARSLARWLIEAGVHGLLICSTTGEAPLLDREDRRQLVEAVAAEVNGEVPLLVGVSAPATRHAVEFARDAEQRGATHIVALGEHFIPVSDAEMECFFAAIADAVSVPTLLYNYPGITSGRAIPPALAAKLAREHNVVGIKDSSGDFTAVLQYAQAAPPGFAVFTGMECLLLSALSHGCAGAICAAANAAPELLVRLYDYFNEGEIEDALSIQRQLVDLTPSWSLGTFPAAVKAGCALRGIDVGVPFAPGSALTPEQLAALEAALGDSIPLGD